MTASVAFLGDRPTVLVTGANGGLGQELVRQYAIKGWNVIATCRNRDTAPALRAIAAAHSAVAVEALDITSQPATDALVGKYRLQPIDVLLNNAGIYGDVKKQSWGSFDFDELRRVMEVDAIRHLRVTAAFLESVLRSRQKKIISLGGRIGNQSTCYMFPPHYFQRMAKAAHLMAMTTLQSEMMHTGVHVTMIGPGQTDTALARGAGLPGQSRSAAQSAAQVIERIEKLDPTTKGRLVMADGSLVPW